MEDQEQSSSIQGHSRCSALTNESHIIFITSIATIEFIM